MSKIAASLFSVALTLAVLSPINEEWRGKQGDSFPLSWYPMFSRPRPDPDRSYYVVGITADGTRHYIRGRYYARGGMNQIRRQLGRTAREPKLSRKLCRKVAQKMAKKSKGPLSEVERIKVARGYFHMKKYFAEGDKMPVKEHVFASCRVPRRKSKTRASNEGDKR